MEPPSRKPAQCYVPKKVYTFKLQQEQLREESGQDKGAEKIGDVKQDTVNYEPDEQKPQSTHQGKKKFPAQCCMDENEPKESGEAGSSSIEEHRSRNFRSKAAVSRGKTAKHLTILMSQQNGQPDFENNDTTDSTGMNQSPGYEGSKRHREICTADAEPKRSCDKSHLHKGHDQQNNIQDDSAPEPDNGEKKLGELLEEHASKPQQLSNPQTGICRSQEGHHSKKQSPLSRRSGNISSSGLGLGSSYICLANSQSQDAESAIRIGEVLKREQQQMGLDMCDEISSSVDHLKEKGQPAKRGRPSGSGSVTGSGRGRIKIEPNTSSTTRSGNLAGVGERQDCTICGDIAAGFHCGAYVCEACKVCKPFCNHSSP